LKKAPTVKKEIPTSGRGAKKETLAETDRKTSWGERKLEKGGPETEEESGLL